MYYWSDKRVVGAFCKPYKCCLTTTRVGKVVGGGGGASQRLKQYRQLLRLGSLFHYLPYRATTVVIHRVRYFKDLGCVLHVNIQ